MKLNNRGWGLQTMMIFVLILMICLVVVAVLIEDSFVEIDSSKSKFDYSKLETKVVEATKKYIENKKIQLEDSDSYRVTLKKLQSEKLIDELKDTNSKCTGYGIVEKRGDKFIYNAYIKCGSNYKTNNYVNNLAE